MREHIVTMQETHEAWQGGDAGAEVFIGAVNGLIRLCHEHSRLITSDQQAIVYHLHEKLSEDVELQDDRDAIRQIFNHLCCVWHPVIVEYAPRPPD